MLPWHTCISHLIGDSDGREHPRQVYSALTAYRLVELFCLMHAWHTEGCFSHHALMTRLCSNSPKHSDDKTASQLLVLSVEAHGSAVPVVPRVHQCMASNESVGCLVWVNPDEAKHDDQEKELLKSL